MHTSLHFWKSLAEKGMHPSGGGFGISDLYTPCTQRYASLFFLLRRGIHHYFPLYTELCILIFHCTPRYTSLFSLMYIAESWVWRVQVRLKSLLVAEKGMHPSGGGWYASLGGVTVNLLVGSCLILSFSYFCDIPVITWLKIGFCR